MMVSKIQFEVFLNPYQTQVICLCRFILLAGEQIMLFGCGQLAGTYRSTTPYFFPLSDQNI
jgi:hypothetical protein